jgi:hypothetical protein
MNQHALDRTRFERNEAYLMDRMDHDERLRFERELLEDADLQAELTVQRENTLAIELGGVDRQLKQLVAEQLPQPSVGRGNWTRSLKYAAAVAVLLGGALWYLLSPTANERLFTEYHVVDPGLPVPMSATNDPVFHDAMVAFKLGDFDEARSKWTPLLLAEPANDTLQFYIACAALEEGELQDAIILFQELAMNEASVFNDKGRWYLFLSHLKMNDRDALRAMALEEDPVYGERVRAILSDPRL